MAKQYCTSGSRSTKSTICQIRRLKVREGRYIRTIKDKDHSNFDEIVESKVPWINIQGQWLEQAGFSINTPIKVRVMHGCLVLTTQPKLGEGS